MDQTALANDRHQVAIDGIVYRIGRTAFRSHYEVVRQPGGEVVGLIEMIEGDAGRLAMTRPASMAGMTHALMVRIARAAQDSGLIE
jgi:hypothetical protein